MAASERRELVSRLIVLLAHLLKRRSAREQREAHQGNWRRTIREQRRQINELLSDAPSLCPRVEPLLLDNYYYALEDAQDEMGLRDFPAQYPWTAAEILSADFWPN